MAKKAELTLKNFDHQLNSTVRSIKKQSEISLQTYIDFAGSHYLAEGDAGLLSKCVNACIGVPALATGKMIGYIVASSDLKAVTVTIKAGKNEGKKQKVFKREVSGSATPRAFELPDYNWSMFEKPESTEAWDDLKAIQNVIKKYRKEFPIMKGKHLAESLQRCKVLCAMVGDEEPLTVKLAAAA